MGYTHYFTQHRAAMPKEWAGIVADFNLLVKAAPVTIVQDSEEGGAPVIDDNEIFFNGVRSEGHETMVLYRDGRGFDFCKTAKKPYDILVTGLLIIANHRAPDAWEIKSDGSEAEWQPALQLLHKAGLQYELPEGLRP